MKLRRALAIVLVLVAFGSAAHAQRQVKVYRPLSRSAEELLAPVAAALGDGGSAAIDAGTNALVLIGEPQAIDAALAVLGQLDRPLATVVLHYESKRLADLDAAGVHVAWNVGAGSFRVGNVAAPPGADVVAVHPVGEKTERRESLAGTLRVQDGQAGRIETGSQLPVATRVSPWETQVGMVNASSGFEARPHVLGDGRIRVSLEPFEGRLQRDGTIQTGGAATEVTVAPGETVAIGGLSQPSEQRTLGTSGAASEKRYDDWVLLLRAEVEGAGAAAPR